MPSVFSIVHSGTVEELRRAFDPETDSVDDLLFVALARHAPVDRVALANFLLDHGADASRISDGSSVLNLLCSSPECDFELEAPLLQRLLVAGADVNHRDQYGDVPLTELQNHPVALDAEMVPFYEVLLDWPALDLSLPVNPAKPDGLNIRESVFASDGYVRRRLRTMIEERGL